MLHRNTKIIAIIGILFFVVSVSSAGMFFYSVEKQKAQFIEQKIERAQMQANEESLVSLVTRLEETQDARTTLRTRILRDEEVIDLLAEIESIGTGQSTELVTNSLTVEPRTDTFETLVIRLSVDGSYEAIMHVLKILEQLPYQSSVNKIQIMRSGAGLSSWTSVYEVRVTKYKKV